MARFAPSQATSKIYMYVYAENIFRQLPPNVKKEWYIFCLLLVFLWVYRAIGTQRRQVYLHRQYDEVI
jgi:hypothetical protein